MTRVRKIILSIMLIFTIGILFQNVSYALDDDGDGWDDAKSFHGAIVKDGTTENGVYRNRFWIYPDDSGNPDFIIKYANDPSQWEWVDDYPVLDQTRGMLCVQHELGTSDKDDKGNSLKQIIKNKITISGKTQTVFGKNANYQNREKENTGLIAYILTYTNLNAGTNNRKNRGAQGALWACSTEYFNSFPGNEDKDFASAIEGNTAYADWATTDNAKAIKKCAKAYNDMIKKIKKTSVTQEAGFQWKLDSTGSNYIVGPFKATYNEYTTTYNMDNKQITEKLAGVTGYGLTNGAGQAVSYKFCNSTGGDESTSLRQNFYLKIPVNGLGNNLNLTFSVSDRHISVDATFWDIKVESYQRRIYIPEALTTWVPDSGSTTFSPSESGLTVEKVDKDTGNPISGMQFKIKYNNSFWISSEGKTNTMTSYTKNESSAKVFTTDSAGHISLQNLCDGSYEIIEVGVGNNWQYEIPTPNSFKQDVNRNKPTRRIENKKVFIRITGYVWVDRDYQPDKEMIRNDLYKNDGNDVNDKLLQGVDVTLKNANDANFNNDGRATTAVTDANGAYQFTVRREDLDGMYVEFDYDGLEYQCVSPNAASNGSKAAEGTDRRDPFNANFTTIEGDGGNKGHSLDASGNRSQDLTYTIENHVATLNNVVTQENANTITITNKGYYHIQADTTKANYVFKDPGGTVDVIQNVNLGLYERQDPDLAIAKDIKNVRLEINGKRYIYEYNQRLAEGDETGDYKGFNVGVKFENQYKTKYNRAIYRADYEYTNSSDKSKELQVYITYRILIGNQSTDIETSVNTLYEYFDSNYTLVQNGVGRGLSEDQMTITDNLQYNIDQSYNSNNGYSRLIIQANTGAIQPEQNAEVYVQFQLNRQAVVDILNQRETLDNFVEIASYSSVKDGKPYAGVDIDSNPGNADPTNENTVEDDTDVSPTLLLEVANAREITGTVFVDEAEQKNGKDPSGVMTGEIRQGDGKYDESTEGTVGNVDVTFKEQAENEGEGVTYITKTVEDAGTYKFYYEYYDSTGQKFAERYEKTYIDQENNLTETNSSDFSNELPAGTTVIVTPQTTDGSEEAEDIYTVQLEKGDFYIVGYIPGKYTLTYTWGDETYPVQNYKGTIYDTTRYQENYVDSNTKWYDKEAETRYTDAIDDYQTRLDIDSNFATIDKDTLRGDAYYDSGNLTKMDSTTPTMEIDVEYGNQESVGEEYTTDVRFRYVIPNIDFGIIRRAKQDYLLEKRISHVKITLANGRTLADIEIEDGEMKGITNTAVYMPPSDQYPYNGLLRFEMDDEIMQGASVELTYALVITNTSEVDYVDEDFYNFGTIPNNNEGIVTITPSKIVDYLDNEWEFKTSQNEYNWKSDGTGFELADEVKDSEGYSSSKVFFTDYCDNKDEWELDPITNTSKSVLLNVSKILSSAEDITLDNEAEIVEITKPGGSDIEDDITPGNYPPGLEEEDRITISEKDDDKAPTFSVTSNTGENRNYVLPITIIITSLMVLIGGIVFIKKKVLNK